MPLDCSLQLLYRINNLCTFAHVILVADKEFVTKIPIEQKCLWRCAKAFFMHGCPCRVLH